MKNQLRFFGIAASLLMVVGVFFSSHSASSQKQHDITFNPAYSHFHADFIALNDAAIPSVEPVYGKSVNVFAAQEPTSGFLKNIRPTANSPPREAIRG